MSDRSRFLILETAAALLGPGEARPPTGVIVDHLDEHRGRAGVEPVCAVVKDAGVRIAPSSYYAAKSRLPSARSRKDARPSSRGGFHSVSEG